MAWSGHDLDRDRFVAEEEGRLVGMSMLYPSTGRRVYLNASVHPDFRRRGVGSRLLALALTRQKELGIVPQGTVLAARPEEVKPWDELTADEQRLAARHTTEHLDGKHVRRAPRGVAADQRNREFIGAGAQSACKTGEPVFICIRQRQRQCKGQRLRTAGGEIAEVAAQRLLRN